MLTSPTQQSTTATPSDEVFIGTVDVWQLRTLRWPILRMLARRYVEERELGRYVRDLLATRQWQAVRVTPHAGSRHQFDLFGQRF